MPITFTSEGGFLNGTISSSNGDVFIITSGSAGSINIGEQLQLTGSQIIEKDTDGNIRNKKTFNSDGSITQEKFDANEKIVDTKVKDPDKGKEYIRSGSATTNQIEMQQNSSGAFITVSGSSPGFNVLNSDRKSYRLVRETYDQYIDLSSDPFNLWTNGITGADVTANGVTMKSGSFVFSAQTSISNPILILSASGKVIIPGTLQAQEFHTEVTSASILLTSGSTIFGNSHDDTHTFTGTFVNAITASGNISSSGNITAVSMSGDGSGLTNISTTLPANVLSSSAQIASDISGSSNSLSSSLSNRIFQEVVQNSSTASFVENSVTASILVRNSQTGSFVVNSQTGSFLTSIPDGTYSSSLQTLGNITASGNISQSNSTSTGSFGFGVIRNKLGVGTHQPDYDLDVAGTVGVANYIYHNGDEDTHILMETDMINLVAGGKSIIKGDQDEGWIRINNTNADLDFQVNDKSGNIILHADAAKYSVGIGTDSPPVSGSNGYMLAVEGDISASGDLHLESTKKLYFNKTEDTYLDSDSTDRIRFVAGGQQMLVLDYDTGNRAAFGDTKVSIGAWGDNHQPSKALEVSGDISSSGYLDISAISSSGHIYLGGVLYDSDGPASYYVDPSGNTRLNNLTTVGPTATINNSLVTARITASGNISASGTIVGSNLSGTNTGDQDLSGYVLQSVTASLLVRNTETASFVQNSVTASILVRNSQTGSFLTSLPAGTYSSSLQTLGNITASGDISASGTITSTDGDFNSIDVEATANLDVVDIDGPTTFASRTVFEPVTFTAGDTNPDVRTGRVFLTNNGAFIGGITIDGFDNGIAGQIIHIIHMDNNTDYEDGTNLQLFRGLDLTTHQTNDTITFVCVDGTKWVELCRSDNT